MGTAFHQDLSNVRKAHSPRVRAWRMKPSSPQAHRATVKAACSHKSRDAVANQKPTEVNSPQRVSLSNAHTLKSAISPQGWKKPTNRSVLGSKAHCKISDL